MRAIPPSATAPLTIHLLGDFRVVVHGAPVPQSAWRQKGAAAIVKLLALEPTHRLHREQLMDVLWPELEREAQQHTLRQMLYRARGHLAATSGDGASFLLREGETVMLAPAEQLWVDVDAFEQAVQWAWRTRDPVEVERALAYYAGELLPDDRYAEWAETRRTILRTSYLTLLSRLAQLYEQQGALDQAIATLQRLVAAEPTQEAAHVGLMRLLAQRGQRAEAFAQYQQLVTILALELETEPESITQQLAMAIRHGRFPDLIQPADRTAANPTIVAPTPAVAPRLQLPAPLSALLGREREVAELQQLLATHRLLTLTGPGGIGKTRLAVALGQAVQERFPDGAAFVDLAPARDPELVADAIAHTLGVREQGGRSLLDSVLAYLRDKRLLLVLDNFEHLVTATPLVARLLEHAPQLRCLVTSRVQLRLRGEQEYPVGPLAVPDPAHRASAETLRQYAAVELFVQRAQEVRPAFELTPAHAESVAAICQRLDGLPLAIELAAARTRVLSPPALVARLAQPLALLTGGPHDLPERQQTLRATIQWSYDLLPPRERQLFRQLSVFVGNWSLAAAEAVMKAAGDRGTAVLDGLQLLVEHSLITAQDPLGDQPRFGMLETIRQFGQEQLALTGEAVTAHEQHARVFIELAERAIPELAGEHALTRIAELSAEVANLREAFRWLVMHEPAHALRVFVGLNPFWYLQKQRDEAVFWLDQALARNPEPTSPDQALGHCHIAFAKAVLRDFDTASMHAETCLSLFRRLEDQTGIARAINMLGVIATHRGDPERAIAYFEEALARVRAAGDQHGVAHHLSSAGMVYPRVGDLERGVSLLRESLAIKRSLGDAVYVCRLLNVIGQETCYQGRYEQAIADLEECLPLARQLGASPLSAETAALLGRAMVFRGDLARAIDFLRESLEIARALSDARLVALGLESMASLAVLRDEPAMAGRLFGAAHVWRKAAGFPLYPEQVTPDHYYLAMGKSALSATAWDDAWQAGAAMTFEEAVAYALATAAILQRERASALAPLLTRRSGRVILVDRTERVLLLLASIALPDNTQQQVWVLPGGGLQDGEAAVVASARRLAEQTSLQVAPTQLRGPVAVCRGAWSDRGLSYWAEDAFFWLRVAECEVELEAPDPSASELISDYRWWAPAELSTSGATVYPRGLATLVTRFLAGDLPTLTDVIELPPSCLAGARYPAG